MKLDRSLVVGLAVLAVSGLSYSLYQPTSAATALVPDGEDHSSFEDLPDVLATDMFDGPNEAELFDLTDLAKQKGISVDEALARYGWGRNFSMVVEKLVDLFPADYAGAAIEQDGSAWVAFRGQVPAAAMELVATFNSRVLDSGLYGEASTQRVDLVQERGFSERDLNARTIAAHYAVYGKLPEVREVSTSYDQKSGEVEITLIVDSDQNTGGVERAAAELAGPVVRLRVIVGPIGGDDATHKGGQPTTDCTAGFVVYNTSATRGIATAAHCQDQQTMNGIALDFVFAHNSTYGDMQWHNKAGESFPDDFLAGNATTWNANNRDVAGMGTPVVGLAVYKNGKNGFRDLDEIKALGHCVNGACNLVRVYQNLAVGGDSGGPWYFGNTAYGLHKGDNLHDFAIRDVFTRVDHLAIGMLVNVAVS